MTAKKDYFKTFCEISKAFGTTLDREALLSLIVRSAIDALDGKAACLFLEDAEKDVFVPVCQEGLSENYLHADPYRGKALVREMLAGGYLAFHDVATDERIENRQVKQAEGIASLLVVPVIVEQKTIGVLSLYTAAVREFSDDEIEFLRALAEQGGVAIQNTRLVERINRNSALFFELASNINSSLDINKIFHILSADISDGFGMKGVSVRIFDPITRTMEVVASYGLSEAFVRRGPVSPEENEVVARTLAGETVYIEDVATDERVLYKEAALREGVVSMLCLPITARGEVIGVIRLCSKVKRDFSENLVNLLKALAHQGGIAIQNARLVERMKQNALLFHDMVDNINSTRLDIGKILHILTADIAESFNMKGVNIRLLNKDTGGLDLVATYGLSEAFLNKGPIFKDQSVTRAMEGETVVVRDARTDERILYKEAMRQEGIVSMLCVPIQAGDEVIGVMRLFSEKERTFPEDLVILVEALAHQGGIAIQNASLYLSLQEDKKNLEQDMWSHRLWF